jgi:hypothetical protein
MIRIAANQSPSGSDRSVGDAAGFTKPPFGSKELPFGRRGYQRFGGRREV